MLKHQRHNRQRGFTLIELMIKLGELQPIQFIKNGSEDFILVSVICVSFFLMYALNKSSSQTIANNQSQPAPVQVSIKDQAVLPVVEQNKESQSAKLLIPSIAMTKTNSDETVTVPDIPVLKLKLTQELTHIPSIKKYPASKSDYLPRPSVQQGPLNYKKLMAQVKNPASRKNNSVFLLDEKDDGTGVHVVLRNTALPASSAMQPKVETQDADISKFSKNNLAPSATTLTPARNESPEYKIVQEDKEGVLIRQGNKVSLIRSGEKLPDGNKAGQK